MARSRAERRHNTHVKTSARKAIAYYDQADDFKPHTVCGRKVSRNGEAVSCALCESIKRYKRPLTDAFRRTQLDSFMKAMAE